MSSPLPTRRHPTRARRDARETRPAAIRDACTAGLVRCSLCETGFRRVDGVHVGSQRLGMIPDVPCDRVFATHGGNMTDDNTRPWMAYVDGEPLLRRTGDARRFASAEAACAAARTAAPRKWHD